MNNRHRYAFYGSLRKGLANFARFGHDFEFISTERILGFRMYAMEHYPYVVYTGNQADTIVVEIVEIKDAETELELHLFELSVGYIYQEIEFREGAVGIYVFENYGDDPIVPDGDWVSYFCH
jgi:gamma-glutamylcyclotransferase (GGCT)/AIG2-like uncharacterized protein YtfP